MADAKTLQNILIGLGIPPGPFQALIHSAIVNSWTSQQLLAEMYASPAFAKSFPGIFRSDGSLRMTAGEWRRGYDTYSQQADFYGFTLSKQTYGSLLTNNRSPQEFTDILEADRRIGDNPAMAKAFQAALKRDGVQDVDRSDLIKWAVGAAPKKFYDVYERTFIGGDAAAQGVKLSQGQIGKVKKAEEAQYGPNVINQGALASGFSNIALEQLKTMPLSKLYGMGLTKSDLIAAEFGGPRQAQARAKIAQVSATDQAFGQTQAQLVGAAVGTNQTGERAQS